MLALLFLLLALMGVQPSGYAASSEGSKNSADVQLLSLKQFHQSQVKKKHRKNIGLKDIESLAFLDGLALKDSFVGISIGTGGVKLVFDLFAATLFAIGILTHKSGKPDPSMFSVNNDNNLPNLDGPSNQGPGGDKKSNKSDLKICDDVVRKLRDSESEKYEHILGQPRHKLDKIGKNSDEIIDKALNLVQKAIDHRIIKNSGEYTIRGMVDGHELEVRGAVIGSAVKIGTFFIDKNCC